MSKSKIEWTDSTWNPSVGCTKISEGCKFCYAETMSKRLQSMGTPGYEDGFKFKIIPDKIDHPFKVKKPTVFFVNSMSDLFHEKMPFSFLDQIFEVIKKTPQHTYQILTKRENKLEEYFSDRHVPPNAWLGVTVEVPNSKKRIDILRTIDAKVRFLSIEPLLADMGTLNLQDIHWVIVGGESGHKARPMKLEWVRNIQQQCSDQQIPFFFKQWGSWGVDGQKRSKKLNGRILFGQEWNEVPEILLV